MSLTNVIAISFAAVGFLVAAMPTEKPAAAPPTTPAKATVTVGPPPDLTLGLVKAEPVSVVKQDACWACGGSGRLDSECNACDGTGKVEPVDVSKILKPAPVKAAPLYTQSQPAAKPKAAAAPVVRYYYVQPRQQSSCANGQCGTRRGFFGRRR